VGPGIVQQRWRPMKYEFIQRPPGVDLEKFYFDNILVAAQGVLGY